MAAHFFVFYYGIVADITPPVALAAYAGSAIAKSNPMKTGITATKLAIAAFIVPYIFCLNPAMLFVDTTVFEVIQMIITALLGIFSLAAALNGFLSRKIPALLRVVMAIGGVVLMYPTIFTDLIGIVILAFVYVWQKFGGKKAEA